MEFPLEFARGCFPSLKNSDIVYFDNTQAPRSLGAVSVFEDDGFAGDSDELLGQTRESLAYLLNSNVDWASEEIVIAADASELTARLSLALAKSFPADAEVIVTDIDDEAAIKPWLALEPGVTVTHWPVKLRTAGIDTGHLQEILTDRTRVVVMAKASGAAGSILELLPVALGVQAHQSSLLLNWSAFLPHGAIDVRFLRSDFVIASTRLFFGADVAFLWGSRERMRALRRTAPEIFAESKVDSAKLAGFGAALRYIEKLGLITQEMQLQPSEDYGRRRHMRRGMQAIRHHERSLTALALLRLRAVPGATVYGISNPDAAAHRVPHILFRVGGLAPSEVAAALLEKNVRVSHGNGGAPRLMRALGLPEDEGAVSLSMLHYNSVQEIERFADSLHEIVPQHEAASKE